MKTITILIVAACVLSQTFGLRLRPQLDGRIVGGDIALIEDFPYQLSFQYADKHICGASILSAKSALTAAHCTAAAPTKISIRAGSSLVGMQGVVVNVNQVFQHPDYNTATVNNDASVLQLEKLLTFEKTIAPVSLQPINDEPIVGLPAVVTGWGKLTEGGVSPLLLQRVILKNIPRDTCNELYGGGITEQMICFAAEGKDSCQGDSGGPLVSGGDQVGIVSWGYGCARPKYPGVYTNIANPNIHNHITAHVEY